MREHVRKLTMADMIPFLIFGCGFCAGYLFADGPQDIPTRTLLAAVAIVGLLFAMALSEKPTP